MNLLDETELAYCDSCGNYVPVVEDEEIGRAHV